MTSDVSSRPSVLKKKPTSPRPSAISALPALLLLVGFLLIEPNLLASQLKQVGFGLVAASAVLAVLNDRGVISWAKSSPVVLIFTLLATFWLIAVDSNSRRDPIYSITDGFILFVCIIAAGVVLSNQRRLLYFTRGFVFLVTAVALSYVITAGIWAAGAVGIGEIFKLPVGTWTATVFFPLTSTTGTQTFLGVTLPRLAGIGREPGWMSMYGGVAFFLAPLVIASRRKLFWTRTLAIVAVLAPISTGGFVVFVIAAAYAFFLKKKPGASLGATFFRRAFGLIASAGAVWLVVNAPVLGLNAKEGMNAVSLSERNFVTAEGLKALGSFSLGGPAEYPNASLNLVASVAPNGWPYLVLILAALLMPRVGHPLVSRSTAAIMVITLTLLFSQPTAASSAIFILVVAIYAAAAIPPLLPTVEIAPAKAKAPRPLPRR